MVYEIEQDDYLISTDRRKLSISTIHNYLKNAYWSKNKPKNLVKKSIKGSICFGVYHYKKQHYSNYQLLSSSYQILHQIYFLILLFFSSFYLFNFVIIQATNHTQYSCSALPYFSFK